MQTDKRYTIQREFTGAESPQWVVRFCGEWLSAHSKRPEALRFAQDHQESRQRLLDNSLTSALIAQSIARAS